MKNIFPTIDFSGLGEECLQGQVFDGVSLFREMGVLQIKNFYSEGFIQQLKSEFDVKYKEYFQDRVYKEALNVGDQRTMLTICFEGAFSKVEYYFDRRLGLILKQLLGEKLIINSLGAVISLPGAKEQAIHRDNPNVYARGGTDMMAQGLPYAITVGIPLVKTDELCGGTCFWPGTHLNDVLVKDLRYKESVSSFCDLGSIILFDYRILHQGLANKSNVIRPMLYNVYSRPWFRDRQNYKKQAYINLTKSSYENISDKDKYLFSWLMKGG